MMTHDLIGRTLMAPEKENNAIIQSLFFLTQHCSLRRKEKKNKKNR